MDLFPIFLKIAARPCLVIGAGNLAESKIESLQAAHARVTVIAPDARPRIADMAGAGEVEWLRREYAEGDLAGVDQQRLTQRRLGQVAILGVLTPARESNLSGMPPQVGTSSGQDDMWLVRVERQEQRHEDRRAGLLRRALRRR